MLKTLVLFLVALAAAVPAQATEIEIKQVSDMAEVAAAASRFGYRHGPENVLVVFDIDNTLLTMNQDLGSDGWFRWHNDDIGNLPKEQQMAAFYKLLRNQYVLYGLSDMAVTEPGVPNLLNGLEGAGYWVMALTARGPEVRDHTLRELRDAGIDFDHAPRCGGILCRRHGQISKKTVLAAAKAALSDEEIGNYAVVNKLNRVGYANGVMMVSGQHKGAMLRTFLAMTRDGPFNAIVFVDDSKKNVDRVKEAFKGHPAIEIFHYIRLEEDVEDFAESPTRQKAAEASWVKIKDVICRELNTVCD